MNAREALLKAAIRQGAEAYAELLRRVQNEIPNDVGTDRQAYDHIIARLQDKFGSYEAQIVLAVENGYRALAASLPQDSRDARDDVIELIYEIVGAPKDAPYGDLPGYVRDALRSESAAPGSTEKNSEAPTPRTDHVAFRSRYGDHVPTAFARQLERELAEMSALNHRLAANQIGAPVSASGAIPQILAEIERARAKHPAWPADDTLFAAAIVSEESGELMRAAVQHRGEGGSLEACDKEAIQTAAVAIRFLERK